LTLNEVAARFKFTEAELRDFINRRKIPVLRKTPRSHKIRFNRAALEALTEALTSPCPSSASSPANRPVPSRSRGRILSPEEEFNNALRATTPNSPPNRPRRLRQNSSEPPGTENVVALVRSQQR